jgi:hypothetical protein
MPVRSSQEDFLLRELRKIAAMVARAMGFRRNGDLPAARTEITNAYSSLLGPQSDLLRMLDPVSAARLVGDPRKLVSLARLTAEESALAAAEGKPQVEKDLATRSRFFVEEAVRMDPAYDEAAAALEELRTK